MQIRIQYKLCLQRVYLHYQWDQFPDRRQRQDGKLGDGASDPAGEPQNEWEAQEEMVVNAEKGQLRRGLKKKKTHFSDFSVFSQGVLTHKILSLTAMYFSLVSLKTPQ